MTLSRLPYKTYGEVFRPLEIDRLPPNLRLQLMQDPELMTWVLLVERVLRAEKISSWVDWTEAEHAAYDSESFEPFSRLRGYSEEEIADFSTYLQGVARWSALWGEDEVAGIVAVVQEAMETEQSAEVDDFLVRRSREAQEQGYPGHDWP